jgi:hypothetical protein
MGINQHTGDTAMTRRTADDFRRDMEQRKAADPEIDEPVTRTSPADEDRKAIIDRQAAESLLRLNSDFTLNDWRNVWEKLRLVTEEVMDSQGLVEYDPDSKRLVREITKRMDDWERSKSNRRPMSKSERWAMREYFGNPKYEQWLNEKEMSGARRRRMNSPGSVINAYKRDYPDPNKPKRERKVSEVLSPAFTAKNKLLDEKDERIKELEQELTAARAKGATEKTAAPRNLDAARAAYVRLVVQAFGADKKAIKDESKRLAKASVDLLYEMIKAGSLKPPTLKSKTKTKTKTTKGRVIAHVPGIGNIFEG